MGILLFVLALLCSAAHAEDADPKSVATYDPSKGLIEMMHRGAQRRVVVVDRPQVARTREWFPQNGWPLSISELVPSVEARLAEENPGVDEFRLTLVQFKQFQQLSWFPANRWYYVLVFDPVVKGSVREGELCYAVVLLDGTVVLPEARTLGEPAGVDRHEVGKCISN